MTDTRVALALLLIGCSARPTTLEVIVDSELAAPGEIDAIEFVVDARATGGSRQFANVDLSASRGDALPARLGLEYGGGDAPTGPFTVLATGRLAGVTVVSDQVATSFVLGAHGEVRLLLTRACIDVGCDAGERCERGRCEDVELDAGLADGGLSDAGQEGCTTETRDCDDRSGCEVSILDDVENCGGCGRSCLVDSAHVALALCVLGECQIECEENHGDCNDRASDGCETDLRRDAQHCGACGAGCIGASVEEAACDRGECTIETCVGASHDCDGDPDTGCECPAQCSTVRPQTCL